MMRSMTGYGRGEARHEGIQFTVELNSVNRKQSDVAIDLPREMIEWEPRIREIIHTVVSRGRLHVVAAWHHAGGLKTSEVRLDEAMAKAYMRGIARLKRNLKVKGAVNLDTILRCPGVLKLVESEIDMEKVWPSMERAVRQALDGLLKMREKEGIHLAKDLSARLDNLSKSLDEIQALAPAMIERYREQLRERIRKSGIDLAPEDDRLIKEIAFFADRSDISEEITRLKSHFIQFRDHLVSSDPVGRALDFLAQEIHREINTLGSKANHTEISKTVVFMKGALEKIREQIQNVE